MKINYVIGDPVGHSISPVLHNEAYKQLGIADKYLFKAEQIVTDELENFINKFRADVTANGLAVTMPHKQAIIEYLDEVDKHVQCIGAVNTVIKQGDKLLGFNTDWLGSQSALAEITDIKNKKVSLLGSGSTARGIAYAMQDAGTQLTIFGRDNQKVIDISKDFGALPASIEAKAEIANGDIIINATSVGISESNDTELLAPKFIKSDHIVFDVVYGRETNLVKVSKQKGATVLTGLDMLLHQAIPQCEIHTGVRPDIKKLRQFMEELSRE